VEGLSLERRPILELNGVSTILQEQAQSNKAAEIEDPAFYSFY